MTSDLTGGLPLEFEYFLDQRPANPDMRDSASLWVMDQSKTLAFPRITIDAIASDWEHPWLQLNLVHADGRAFRVWSGEARHNAIGPEGRPSVLGAGPLKFHCFEPFRRWRIEFDGTAEQTTSIAQMNGERGGEPVDLAFHFDAEMAAPPWLMGGMTAEMAQKMISGDAGALMGGLRYEQLCRLEGQVKIGRQEYSIFGTGMRVRRQGVRNMGAATGHCQHSALFPSGRAFGAIVFPPAPDGSQTFNEGFVFTGDGELVPAHVIRAPWMTTLNAAGDDVTVVLESDIGEVMIEGETLLSTFDLNLFEMADTSVLHQGVARYVWDGEETVGLIERCTLRNQLARLP